MKCKLLHFISDFIWDANSLLQKILDDADEGDDLLYFG